MTKKMLLENSIMFEYNDSNIEEQDNGCIIVEGVVQRADAENHNGRIYPYNSLLKEVENYKKKIRDKCAWGELDHRDSPTINMENVSHRFLDIWEKDKTFYAKVQVLGAPTKGAIIQTMIKAGGRPGISSRSLGTVKKQNGVDMVDELQLICWDFVSDPSTHGAYMNLREGREIDLEEFNKSLSKSEKIDRIANEVLEYIKNCTK
jgi:hypothetical protein